MPKSGLDLRPKPPPSKVTCTVTSSADMASRLATRSRAAWRARHLEAFGALEAGHLGSQDWRTRYDRVGHAVQSGVDAVLRLAVRDVGRVDQLQLSLADIAKVLRILEAQRRPLRDRLRGGGLRERAVSEATAGCAMDDLVILGGHLAHRHLPLIGGRGLQHGARGGAAAAHRPQQGAGAARAVGVLVAELLLVTGRLGDAHALPIRLQPVGDDHRHAGPDSLPP